MAITIKKHKSPVTVPTQTPMGARAANDPGIGKKKQGHAKPLPIPSGLHELARLRVGHLLSLLSISHATLYARLHTASLPKPDGYDGKRPYWRTSTMLAFLQGRPDRLAREQFAHGRAVNQSNVRFKQPTRRT